MKFEQIIKEEMTTPTSPIDSLKLAKDLAMIDQKIEQTKKANQANLDKMIAELSKQKQTILAQIQSMKATPQQVQQPAVAQPAAVVPQKAIGGTQ